MTLLILSLDAVRSHPPAAGLTSARELIATVTGGPDGSNPHRERSFSLRG